MTLHSLPQRLAFILALAAFAVVWVVGLLSDVPVHRVSLRAVGGAAVFWLVGLGAGRIVVNTVSAAVAKGIRDANAQQNQGDGGSA